MSISNSLKPKRSLIVELIGLAGAGKSTLARALSRRDEKIRVAADLKLRNVAHLPVFIVQTPALLPLMLRGGRHSRGFTWDEIKALAYLTGWPEVLKQQASHNDAIILLDHGPVFKLATLNAFGPARLTSPGFEPWWRGIFRQWASTLDMVIWLNAPDTVLVERINGRTQRHAVKGKSEREAGEFLTHYQNSYEQILAQLAVYGGPTLLQFDTHQTPIEQIIDEVLAICHKMRDLQTAWV